jgi:hypothetical protein
MAQYAALAAKSSCLAALVNKLIAALNSKVNTINTPTALKVSLSVDEGAGAEVILAELPSSMWPDVEVSLYMVMTGTTSRTKMTRVMSMLISWSIRVDEYREMNEFVVFARSSGVRK